MARRSGLGKGLGALIPTEVVGDRLVIAAGRPDRQHQAQPAPAPGQLRRGGHVLAGRLDQGARGAPAGPGAADRLGGGRRVRAHRRRAPVAGGPAGRTADDPGPGADVDDDQSLEQALVENLHREDLNALEEAAAYQQLIEEFGYTHEQVANRVGKSRTAVTNTLRLLQLPAGRPAAAGRGPDQPRPRPGPAGHPGPWLPGDAGQAGRWPKV